MDNQLVPGKVHSVRVITTVLLRYVYCLMLKLYVSTVDVSPRQQQSEMKESSSGPSVTAPSSARGGRDGDFDSDREIEHQSSSNSHSTSIDEEVEQIALTTRRVVNSSRNRAKEIRMQQMQQQQQQQSKDETTDDKQGEGSFRIVISTTTISYAMCGLRAIRGRIIVVCGSHSPQGRSASSSLFQ